jgi:hypothetical protein
MRFGNVQMGIVNIIAKIWELKVLGIVRIVGKHWQCVNLRSYVTIGNFLVGMVNIKGKIW